MGSWLLTLCRRAELGGMGLLWCPGSVPASGKVTLRGVLGLGVHPEVCAVLPLPPICLCKLPVGLEE